MSQIDIKFEEYKSLRSSIDMHLKQINEILAIMVAATSALLGYGLHSEVPWIFLTPLPIILSCAYLIRTQMEEVLRKGAYIMIKYENELEYIGWESTLYEVRRSSKEDKKQEEDKKWKMLERIIPTWKDAATDSKAIFLIAMILILICIVCFSYFMYVYYDFIISVISVISIIFVFFLSLSMVLRRVLEAYTYDEEKRYVEKFNKAINEVKNKRG